MTTARTIEADVARKPALPSARTWSLAAQATWDAWWASPIAEEWVDAFVPGLLELLTLVDDFHSAESAKDRAALRAEIRMSSREYGLSPLAMRSLQWEIRRLESQPAAPPTPRRRRETRSLLGVLEGGRKAAAG